MKDQYYYLLIILFYFGLTYLSSGIPFFWDNALFLSKIAHYYYETGFTDLILPTEIDSGHPPFYGLWLAWIWQTFGRTLTVSHWAVFPFLVGIGMSYYHIAKYFLPVSLLPFALLLLFLEPTLLTQSVLGALDIPLVFGTLWAVYAILPDKEEEVRGEKRAVREGEVRNPKSEISILFHKRWQLIPAFILMAGISIRGIIGVALLFICDVSLQIILPYFNHSKQPSTIAFNATTILKKVAYLALPYLPAAAFTIIWYAYHYQHTGFLTSNEQAAWAADYALVDVKGLLKNIAVLGWRILDFGRVILWLMVGYILFRNMRTQTGFSKRQVQLMVLIFIPLIFYTPIITYRTTPILHRYLIVYYVLFGILSLSLLWTYLKNVFPISYKTHFHRIFSLISIILISGHFWVYPNPIAKGWDSFLAVLPYFSLEQEMKQYIDEQQIPYTAIGSEFPMVNRTKITRLTNDARRFRDKEEKPFLAHPYLLHSNVCNDFTAEQEQLLQTKFDLLKEVEKGQVYIRLYQRADK